MDISRLNPLNFLGLSKKANKTEKSSPVSGSSFESGAVERTGSGDDSVNISLEAIIKQAEMEAREELKQVREEKVSEIKEKISSGQYKVTAEDLAAAILKGRASIYEELK